MTGACKLVPAKMAAGITHTSPACTTGRWAGCALQLPTAADAQKAVSPDLRTLTCGSFKTADRWRGRIGQGGMLMENQTRRTRKTKQSERSAEPLPEPAPDSPPTVLALIERVVLDPHADVEKLDRMMTMYERLKAKEAELAFNGAKGRILKKLAGIKIVKNRPVLPEIDNGKPKKGAVEAFKYAPLEEIDKHLRPLLAEEEMDLSYSDEPCEGGGILVRGRLKRLPSGHYEDSFMPAPPDTTGGKSNVQAVGSTNSFLRRYVACNIFNIVVVGDDDDGNGGTIDEAQAKTIVELIKKAKVGPKFL